MPKPSVRSAQFDSESVSDVNELMRNMRFRKDYDVCFSYATIVLGRKGTGANNKVTRTQNILDKTYRINAHMRNGKDDLADDLRDEGVDVDDEQWFMEWMVAAKQAGFVVCFRDAKWSGSKYCQKEYNFCKSEGIRRAWSTSGPDNSSKAQHSSELTRTSIVQAHRARLRNHDLGRYRE